MSYNLEYRCPKNLIYAWASIEMFVIIRQDIERKKRNKYYNSS